MVLKNVFTVIVCTTLLAWSGLAMAGEYRPDQFLGLDLSKAVLSPKRLGPPAEFAPVPVEAKADRGGEAARAESIAVPNSARPTCEATSRMPSRMPGLPVATAIRSMPRRSIRGFRSGLANRAASATGSGRRIERRPAAHVAARPASCLVIRLSQNLRPGVNISGQPSS